MVWSIELPECLVYSHMGAELHMNINLSAQQFRQAADLKDQIEALESELSSLLGGTAGPTTRRRRGMSAVGRARIAAAQRARWAKMKSGGNGAVQRKPRRK